MTDHTIRPIREDVVFSEGKQTMLDTIASTFDDLAYADGREPVAVVFAFVTTSGGCRTGYHTLSEVDGCNTLHIARGVACINMDMHVWDKKHGS